MGEIAVKEPIVPPALATLGKIPILHRNGIVGGEGSRSAFQFARRFFCPSFLRFDVFGQFALLLPIFRVKMSVVGMTVIFQAVIIAAVR